MDSSEPLRSGRQHLLETLTAHLGTSATVIEQGLASLTGVAVFPAPGRTALVTLGFSELDVAPYAYEDSGLGYELVCWLDGPTPPPTLLEALDLIRRRSSVVGQPPALFTSEDRWTMTLAPSAPFEPLLTVNGRVRFIEVHIENRLERAQQQLVSTASRAPDRRTNARSAEDSKTLEAFLAGRDEVAAQVYSDWLEAQGDPRGELASLLRARRHEAWLQANADLIFGDLAAAIPEQVTSLEWRHGFLDHVELVAGTLLPLDELVSRFLALPVARTLQALTVDGENAGEAFHTLADSPVAPALRRLILRDDASGGLETDAQAWSPFRALESLQLELGGCWFADLELPTLRTLIWRSNGLSDEELDALTSSHWPRLVHLEVSTGRDAELSARSLDRLFSGRAFPELVRLGLINSPFLHLVLPRLAQAPLLRRLRVLDLSGGVLMDEDTVALLEAADAFRHLAVLDLSRNQLTVEACEALRGLCSGQVVLLNQRGVFGEDGEVERSVGDELDESRFDAVVE